MEYLPPEGIFLLPCVHDFRAKITDRLRYNGIEIIETLKQVQDDKIAKTIHLLVHPQGLSEQ